MKSTYYTRSKAVSDYKAAGVLPFALHGTEVLVLLGAELTKTGPKGKYYKYLWRDFGGARESVDEDSAATAAREFSEETLGLFGGCSVDARSVELCSQLFSERLRRNQDSVKVVHRLRKVGVATWPRPVGSGASGQPTEHSSHLQPNMLPPEMPFRPLFESLLSTASCSTVPQGQYHMYITQTCYMAPLMFGLATQQNATTGAVPGGEKTAFAWVPLTDLLHAVQPQLRRYRLTCKSAVCGGKGTPPPVGRGSRQFDLHPCFANSLRLAQGCGLPQLLSRAEALPLHPEPRLPPEPAPSSTPPEPAPSSSTPPEPAPSSSTPPPPPHVAGSCTEQSPRARPSMGPLTRHAVPAEASSCSPAHPPHPLHDTALSNAAHSMAPAVREGEPPLGCGCATFPAAPSAPQGPTPEHMCYWLAQKAIAEELGGGSHTAAEGGSASAQGAAVALHADQGRGPTSPPQEPRLRAPRQTRATLGGAGMVNAPGQRDSLAGAVPNLSPEGGVDAASGCPVLPTEASVARGGARWGGPSASASVAWASAAQCLQGVCPPGAWESGGEAGGAAGRGAAGGEVGGGLAAPVVPAADVLGGGWLGSAASAFAAARAAGIAAAVAAAAAGQGDAAGGGAKAGGAARRRRYSRKKRQQLRQRQHQQQRCGGAQGRQQGEGEGEVVQGGSQGAQQQGCTGLEGATSTAQSDAGGGGGGAEGSVRRSLPAQPPMGLPGGSPPQEEGGVTSCALYPGSAPVQMGPARPRHATPRKRVRLG